MTDHTHGSPPASNTLGTLKFLRGCKVAGVIENALPLNAAANAAGNKTLVFDCGYGLTFSGSGSYWIESRGDVTAAIIQLQTRYRETAGRLAELLELAGDPVEAAR